MGSTAVSSHAISKNRTKTNDRKQGSDKTFFRKQESNVDRLTFSESGVTYQSSKTSLSASNKLNKDNLFDKENLPNAENLWTINVIINNFFVDLAWTLISYLKPCFQTVR